MPTTPTVKRLKGNRIECTLSFDSAKVAQAEETAIRELGASVQIQGFRPGHAPLDQVRAKLDEGRILEVAVRKLLPEAIEPLVKEHEIKAIIPPRVEAIARDPLTLKIIFIEQPEVKVKGADKLKVEKKKSSVEDKDVERMVNYVLSQHQKSASVNRPAQEKDRITMDFWGEDMAGQEIDGIRTQNHQVIIGSKVLLPGFEDQLKSMKKGESKDFTLTFPEKHQNEDLRNKPVHFHVTVTNIEEVSLPALTDEFVKRELQFETVDAFKKEIRESLLVQEERAESSRLQQAALDAIEKAVQVELAPELVEEEERLVFEEFSERLKQRNIEFGDWLKQTGKTADGVAKDFKEQATSRLKIRLGLQHLIENREIDLTDEEMEKVVEEMLAPLSAQEREQFEPVYKKGGRAYGQFKWQKKVEKLLEQVIQ